MVGIGAALSGLGAVASAFGGGKESSAQSIPPFEQWPDAVKEAWLETVVPKSLAATTDRDFRALPMTRVAAPSSPFDSKQLYEWQKYSDSLDGLFSPIVKDGASQSVGDDSETAKQMAQALGMQMLMGGSPNPVFGGNRPFNEQQMGMPGGAVPVFKDIGGAFMNDPDIQTAVGEYMMGGGTDYQKVIESINKKRRSAA